MSHITPHKDIALMTAKPYAPARGCGYFRWPYRHADPLVRLLARGFLLVFCCNPSVEMHRFRARDMGQTDRRTDGSQRCLVQGSRGPSMDAAIMLYILLVTAVWVAR